MLYANILETIGNTPIVKLNRIGPKDVNVYVKIESFNPMGSVKDRLARNVIETAERDGSLKPGQTVIEATSGNTGIGLAMVCAAKDYPLVVTMAESFSIERRRMMRFLGAKVVLTPASLKGSGMLAKAAELAEKHDWFLVRQFENEANADAHSRTTAPEILDAFADRKLDYWVSGFGTGGTLKGVSRVLKEKSPETRIVVCEPDNSPILGSGIPQERLDGRHTSRQSPVVSTAPDAGMEPGLYSATRPKTLSMPSMIDAHRTDRRQRCAAPLARSGTKRRDLRRNFWRRNPRRRDWQWPKKPNQVRQHSVHVAGHRRALPQHAAVRRHSCRHDARRTGHREVYAELSIRLATAETCRKLPNAMQHRCMSKKTHANSLNL